MKYKFLLLIILLSAHLSGQSTNNTWKKIENKTWFSLQDGIFGAQIVFLKNKFNEKKAILQLYGSGCIVISTFIFDVDIKNDSINLKSSYPVASDTITFGNNTFIYSNEDDMFRTTDEKIKYYIRFHKPHVYKLCYQEVNIEELKSDTITMNDFR